MAEEDQDQKTEEPSGKRLEEARERGQIPVSREVAMWVGLLGTLMALAFAAPSLARNLSLFLRKFIESPHAFRVSESNLQTLFYELLIQTGFISASAFLILLVFIIAGYMVQTGFFFSMTLMAPDFERLSPARGLKRFFSMHALVELGKSLGKLVLLGSIAYVVLKPIALESPNFTGFRIEDFMLFLHKKVIHLLEMLLLAFIAIAALDLFFTRFQYFRGLRMTKTEVKDEYKQQEGDPMVKARLRQMRIERSRRRMMAQVPKADVVITNPTHYAIALQYDAGKMSAPTVVAKGMNLIALRIREIAEENRVPIVSNPPLARALYRAVDVDEQIPTEHYRAVAEVISYVYKIKQRRF